MQIILYQYRSINVLQKGSNRIHNFIEKARCIQNQIINKLNLIQIYILAYRIVHMHIIVRIATYEIVFFYLLFVALQRIMHHGDNFPRYHAMFSHNRINEMEPINLLKYLIPHTKTVQKFKRIIHLWEECKKCVNILALKTNFYLYRIIQSSCHKA